MNIQKKTLLAAMIVIWIILLLQIAATRWNLYWVLSWFDMLMHFLGGVWLGLMIFALLSRPIPYLLKHKGLMIIVLISGTLFFGFLWEIMEFILDVLLGTNMFQPNLPDTLSDLGLDMIGAIVAATGLLFFYEKKPMNNESKKMKVTFHGAAGDVTGANFLVEVENKKFIVDCGMFQGNDVSEDRNREPFPYDPTTIDVLIVTHAHQDHIGRIPKLIKEGFRGIIYSTAPTKELSDVMLFDTQQILETEARKNNQEPLFEKNDIERALQLWKVVPYHDTISFLPGVTMTFRDAGHVLGSAMAEIAYNGKKILFTGDLGNSPSPLLRDIEEVGPVEYVVMESVYGDRNHEDREDRMKKLEMTIEDTVKKGGVLMIPAFSLERTQELLFELNQLVEYNRVPRVPIYLDSPLSIRVTEIYQNSTEYFKKSTRKIINDGDNIFDFPGLKMTPDVEDSKRINAAPAPKIIIAGSGMMNGGRILHHAMQYVEDPKSTILFVGYQAAGTLGRIIQDGAQKVTIFGKEFKVRARIETIQGYSGHAGSDELVEFVSQFKDSVKKVFCVMGEPKSALFLVQRLRDYLGVNATPPQSGESVELEF